MKKILFPLIIICASCSTILSESDSISHSQVTTIDSDSLSSYHQHSIHDTTYCRLQNGIVLERRDSLYYWDDMVFNEDGLNYIYSQNVRSGARTEPTFYWPEGIVYYRYNSSVSDTTMFRAAMDNISNATSIVFKPKRTYNYKFIEFNASSGNNSQVGMQQNGQIINIHDNYTQTITHEILHSLGFFHEHCRSDRDNYITINWSNIRPEKAHNFQKFTQNGYNIGPLDFNSIMIYDSDITDATFVYDTNIPAMTKLNGLKFYQGLSLSFYDIAGIAAIYGPPFHRLEKHQTLISESYSGYQDYSMMSESDSLVFYADKSCTTRQALVYPRYVQVEYRETFGEDGHLTTHTSYNTFLVPSGTEAICLWEGINTIELYMGEPQQGYDTMELSITNRLVPNAYIYEY